MLAGHDGADAGFTLGNGGEGDAASHKAGVEEGFAEIHCLAAVADDDGRDRGFALGCGFAAYVETGVGELLLEVCGVGPEALDAFGFGLQEVEGCDAGGRDRGRMRGGEEKRTSAMIEVVDEVARAADVAAECSDGLGERAYLHIDASRAVEVIDAAAAVAAEDSGGVGVVDHHDGAVLVGDVAELVDGADVAVHRKDAVGDEEFAAWLVLDLFQELFGVGDIFVAEDLDFGAGEASAVDDARVVQFVGENEVLFAEDARNGSGVGGESGLEDDAGFDTFEGCNFFFELHVNAHGACDSADGS